MVGAVLPFGDAVATLDLVEADVASVRDGSLDLGTGTGTLPRSPRSVGDWSVEIVDLDLSRRDR